MKGRIDEQFISSDVDASEILDSCLLESTNLVFKLCVERVEVIDLMLIMLLWDNLQRLSRFGQCLVSSVEWCWLERQTLIHLRFWLPPGPHLSSSRGSQNLK